MRACALLNGAHDDVANFAGKLPHQTLVSDCAESGGDYLFCRIGGDSAKVFWGYVDFFIGDGAVFGNRAVINRDLTGLAVELGASGNRAVALRNNAYGLLIGGKNRTFDDLDEFTERNLFFAFKGL